MTWNISLLLQILKMTFGLELTGVRHLVAKLFFLMEEGKSKNQRLQEDRHRAQEDKDRVQEDKDRILEDKYRIPPHFYHVSIVSILL